MKHLFTFLFTLVVSLSWAQKKELKQAQKLYKAGKTAEASAFLDTNQTILEGSELKYVSGYNFLRSQIALLNGNFQASYDYLLIAEKYSKLNTKTLDHRNILLNKLNDSARVNWDAEDFENAAKDFNLLYVMDPDKPIYLYYAANGAVTAKNLDLALEYYLILKDIKYDGIETEYYATRADNMEEEKIVNETQYILLKKSKDYINFREAETESKFPEIVKNIGLIYNQLGQNEKAIEAINDARAESPKDIGLVITEAQIYNTLGQTEKYKELIGEAISLDPNNGGLYLNLAIASRDLGDIENAKIYSRKAMELDSSLTNSYYLLAQLILVEEKKINDEMNTLSNSTVDNKRYDFLKEKKESVYMQCVPIYKNLLKVDPNSLEAIQNLTYFYGILGESEKYLEMKKRLEDLKSKQE